MIRPLLAASILCFAATACSETTKVSDDLAESQTDAANPTGRAPRIDSDPGERPVRIGEGGPRFDACQSIGRVTGLRSAELEVLVAPFDSAKRKDGIGAGQIVNICTRSHDQQWLGVVYAPAAADGVASVDCGVSSPVRSKRNYDGPCKSGWVESNFVKLVAG